MPDRRKDAFDLGMAATGYRLKSGITPKHVLDFVQDTIAKHTSL